MPFERGLIAAGDRSSQRVLWTKFRNVVDRPSHQLEVRLEWHRCGGGQSLDLPEQGHQVIRRHHCRCVVSRAVGIRYGKGPPAKLFDNVDSDRVASNAKPLAGEEPVRPDLGVRKGDERMQSTSAIVPGQDIKTERTCEMDNRGAWHWVDGRCDLGHGGVGGGDDDDVDVDRGGCDRLPATHGLSK